MQFWTELLLNPIIIVTALIIGTLGETAKRVIKAKAGDKGWRGVYYVTLPAHPVIIGALIGLIPWLPIPESLTKDGYEFAGRIGTYALAGVGRAASATPSHPRRCSRRWGRRQSTYESATRCAFDHCFDCLIGPKPSLRISAPNCG